MCYINSAFESNWIAPLGEQVDKFEQAICEFTGIKSALAVSSGTAALHLALRSLGVKRGDIVICSDLTFIGSANPILYLGAKPLFIDSEPNTLNMSPDALKRALEAVYGRGECVAAAIIVDLYGIPADYDALLPMFDQYNIPVIEDAAEALGAKYKGRECGNFGKIATLSFNGNKIITTSGGGMVLSNDDEAIEKMRFWATQAREPEKHYYHREMGYNYRLSNICAAIGRGQMDSLHSHIEARKSIHEIYAQKLEGTPLKIFEAPEGFEANYWMNVALISDESDLQPTTILDALDAADIEGRPLWMPMHDQPIFKNCELFCHDEGAQAVGSKIFKKGLCLPSGSALTQPQIERIIETIERAVV